MLAMPREMKPLSFPLSVRLLLPASLMFGLICVFVLSPSIPQAFFLFSLAK
jgi:hypothetical protein